MNTGVLDSLEFPYPPVELQDRFGAIVEKVEGIKSRYQESLTDLETLYGALSQQAFKGELNLSRVQLPDAVEGENIVATTPLPAQFTAPEINLPETELLLPALKNSDKLQPLMEFWLEAYRAQLGGSAFSVEGFITAAQSRLAELHPEADFELGVGAYEHIKSWVFDALAARKLTQAFDDMGNRIQLKAAQA
jgi:type I restriction enzyme S subunit